MKNILAEVRNWKVIKISNKKFMCKHKKKYDHELPKRKTFFIAWVEKTDIKNRPSG